jgi:hypothetical protein
MVLGAAAEAKSLQPRIATVAQRPFACPRGDDAPETLRYHLRAFWLLCLYIPLVTLPWIMTVFLSRRPFGHDSYAKHQGFSEPEIFLVKNWVTAINVLNSIANMVTVPILSALLAQAAVVYTQRRSPSQQLIVRHLFALADRGWSDIRILFGSWLWEEPGSGATRLFLYLATGLTFISKIFLCHLANT